MKRRSYLPILSLLGSLLAVTAGNGRTLAQEVPAGRAVAQLATGSGRAIAGRIPGNDRAIPQDLSGSSRLAPEPGGGDQPNILFIFTDDQRYNTIGALSGADLIQTPNLDSLVAAGTTFTHAYNMGAWHGAVCVASRTMLLSGLPVWEARAKEKQLGELAAAEGLWSQQLKKAGYETYMTGKWHIKTDVNAVFDHVIHERPGMPNQTPAGYNRPLSPEDTAWTPWNKEAGGFWKGGKHWSEVLADDAVRYLEEASGKDTPFFMYLAFNAPHDPRQSPREFVEKYPLDRIPVPVSYLDDYPYKEEMGCGTGLRDEQLAPFPRTPYAVRKHIQEYYASISHMDEQVGKILGALRESGKLENTYIFFTADHGLAVGHHGLMGKQNMFDHSMRVPLVVVGPGIPKGEKRDQQVYLQDITATTYELAGIRKPGHVFFNSFLPAIRNGQAASAYEEIYGCYMDLQRMVRTDRYKLIVYPKASRLLLFDLEKDPEEMRDLSGSPAYQDVLEDMKARLLRQQRIMGDTLALARLIGPTEPGSSRKQTSGTLSSGDFIRFFGSLDNFRYRVQREKKARVAFLGGSITFNKGWREKVMQYLEASYPETDFTFLNAGIPSLGSLPHAFRLEEDVLSEGPADLLFIEAAVNDRVNGTPVSQQRRALEGIVRHALRARPEMNIVLMAFADPDKNADYRSGKEPAEIKAHEDIARHYHLPFINLAEEVYRRIDAKEFDWENDFKNLHPSPFGQEIYFRSIKYLLEHAFSGASGESSGGVAATNDRPSGTASAPAANGRPAGLKLAELPPPLDPSNYDGGRYVSVEQARKLKGFRRDPSWTPGDKANTRRGFVNVPMLVGEKAGASFECSFEGDAAGIALISGPDAGTIGYSIDNGPEKTIDLFTRWSSQLHLPWYLLLADGLKTGKHKLRIRILEERNPRSRGNACRIVHFLVNR